MMATGHVQAATIRISHGEMSVIGARRYVTVKNIIEFKKNSN